MKKKIVALILMGYLGMNMAAAPCQTLYASESINDEENFSCKETESEDAEIIKETEHTYGEWIVEKEATCTEMGSRYKECSVCGDTVTEEIAALGHEWEVEYTIDKEATCLEEGSKSIHCANCDAIESVTIIEKIEHDYGEWVEDKKATCSEAGLKHKECIVCGDTIAEEIAALGHCFKNYVSDNNATCVEDGTKTAKCDCCDATDTLVDEGSATGVHTWSKTVTKATTTKNGKVVYICSDCGGKKSTVIYYPKTVTLSAASYTYTGNVQKPTVTVKDSKGKVIASSNYKVSYSSDCKNVGTYTVTITFKGNYSGKIAKSFKINKASQTITASNFKKKVGDSAFSVKAKRTKGDGTLTYKSSDTKVAAVSSTGKVTIKGVGKATITITAASTKNYNKATKKITVEVKPKTVSIKSLASAKNGQLTVKWGKGSSVTGYQLRYSTKSSMDNATTVTVNKASTVSKTLTGLSKGKKYYVQIRTYKKVGSVNYYSSWSSVKSATTLNVKISAAKETLMVGESTKLKISGTSKTVTWSTSDKLVATVSSKGVVKAKKKGTATITAVVGDQKFTCKVTVKERTKFLEASVNSISIVEGAENAVTINFYEDGAVSYSIADTDIVSCSWGEWNGHSIPLNITAKEMGTTQITITNTYNSEKVTIKVNVTSPVIINIPDTSLSIENYNYKGTITNICEVTNIYYEISKSGTRYYFKIYFDGEKIYGSSSTASECKIGYQILQNGSVIESGTVYSASVLLNQKFVGAYCNGFLDAGTYELVLMNVK